MMSARGAAALITATFLATGCNMVSLTANQTAPVMKVAAGALNMESDVEFARAAAPGSLKTVEGFHLATPDNPVYLAILAEGYCSYTFGLLEDEMEEATLAGKDEVAEELGRRATGLYLRCMNFGLQLLGDGWDKTLYGETEAFERRVKAAGKDHVAGLFWVALGLASAINLNRDDIDLVAYMPKARLIFERVVELDERFYNGGAHMALGMLYTAQGAAMGGNPEQGKRHFERAIELTGGKFLMPVVLYGASYGTVVQDRAFYHSKMLEVLRTNPAVWPEQRLGNELAHRRARRFLKQESQLF